MTKTALSCVATALALTAIASAAAEAANPRELIGRPAPPLSIEEVIEGPQPAAWSPEALAGKAVVVDFWSTWCAPCVEDMPRWNAMVDELAGEPVVFVAVSDEPAGAVERFLEKRRLAGWVAVDTDGSAFEAFGALSRPQAVLIDAAGVVRGVGHTARVTPAVVRRLLAGEETGLVPEPGSEELLAGAGRGEAAEAIYQVGLWPARGGPSRVTTGGDSFLALNVPLQLIVPHLWEVGGLRVELEGDVPSGRFDLVVRTAGAADQVKPLARQALETGLGLEVRREVREVDALVLRVPGAAEGAAAAPPGLRRAASPFGVSRSEVGPGRVLADRVSIAELVEGIEPTLGRPVVDETGLEGHYAVELIWAAGDPASLIAAVEELGLELVEARREAEMLVVARRE